MADVAEELDELEEADIQALARGSLGEGEVILGEGHEGEKPESRGICLAPLLIQKAEDISYKVPEGAKRVPWVDTLIIEGRQPLPKGLKAKDGTKLESAFSSQALDSVKEAFRRLKAMRVPFNRPGDFYAEMLRTDSQMYRVRARAAEETRRMKIVEERKKAQAAKKFQKKSKSKKQEARAAEKKQTLEGIARWQAQQKGKTSSDDQNLEDILNKQALKQQGGGKGGKGGKGDGKGDGKGKSSRTKRKVSRKQEAKDAKYGFGGKKRGKKRNDAKSSKDFSASPWAKKGSGKGRGGGKGKGKGKGKGGGGPQPGGIMKKRKR